MLLEYKGREVEVTIELRPSVVDCFLASGEYTDGDFEQLTDIDLNNLMDIYVTKLDQYCMENGAQYD